MCARKMTTDPMSGRHRGIVKRSNGKDFAASEAYKWRFVGTYGIIRGDTLDIYKLKEDERFELGIYSIKASNTYRLKYSDTILHFHAYTMREVVEHVRGEGHCGGEKRP